MTDTLTCKFCRIVQTPVPERAEQDTCLGSTSSFEWLPALGAIVEGYSLIIGRCHLPGMAGLPQETLAELDAFAGGIRRCLSDLYGESCVVFEHGGFPHKGRNPASSIVHQHLHIVPCDCSDVAEALRRRHRCIASFTSMGELAHLDGYEKPYLYFSSRPDEHLVLDAAGTPSQYIRRLLASKMGQPTSWNWRTKPFHERVRRFLRLVSAHRAKKEM